MSLHEYEVRLRIGRSIKDREQSTGTVGCLNTLQGVQYRWGSFVREADSYTDTRHRSIAAVLHSTNPVKTLQPHTEVTDYRASVISVECAGP